MVQRYRLEKYWDDSWVEEDDEGGMVDYEDYKRLQDEFNEYKQRHDIEMTISFNEKQLIEIYNFIESLGENK